MQIRLITDADLPALLEVYRQSEDFLALGPNPHASLEMIAADRALSREAGGEFCGLFDEQGRLMGVIDFVRSGFEGDPACAFLELLMIAAPYRGQGLGERVFRWLEEELRKPPGVSPPPDTRAAPESGKLLPYRGATLRLRAGVQVNNPGAIRFWQRMGFKIISGPEQMPDTTVCYQLEKAL